MERLPNKHAAINFLNFDTDRLRDDAFKEFQSAVVEDAAVAAKAAVVENAAAAVTAEERGASVKPPRLDNATGPNVAGRSPVVCASEN